jgi:hypothetical protein
VAIDQTIVAQTTAKVAAELVAATQPRNIEDALAAYDRVFMHVLNSINFVNNKETKKTKGGRQIPVISQEEIQMRLNAKLQAGTAVTSNLVQF